MFANPDSVKQQYELWPYPKISLLARVHREQLWQIHLAWLQNKCGLNITQKNPRIWIAGCGTFQPYVIARANPNAEIIATDISQVALRIAQQRCKWHGVKNVAFACADLSAVQTLPTGPFDWIECYGVLMSLQNPKDFLQAAAAQLAPNGLLRLMVYPYYSRQRIFQIQRLAKLLGLEFKQPQHPRMLKNILLSLPIEHPLHYAWRHYYDAQTPHGIVDGFLHAADRGFTGIEICQLIEQAKLTPAFFFHRPWGQPEQMSQKLGLQNYDLALWLHYLDLWQELRTNITVCLIRQTSHSHPPVATKRNPKHPLFDLANKFLNWRDRLRLLRIATTGTAVTSRTHANALQISGKEMRFLLQGDAHTLPIPVREILLEAQNHISMPLFRITPKNLRPTPAFGLRNASQMVNPFYLHLIEAYFFDQLWQQQTGTLFPSLFQQIETWLPHARPLEDSIHPFGLTPFGSYQSRTHEILKMVEQLQAQAEPVSYDALHLAKENEKQQQVKEFIARFSNLPKQTLSRAELLELWVLLFSYKQFVWEQ